MRVPPRSARSMSRRQKLSAVLAYEGVTRTPVAARVQLWSATLCPKAPERGINMVRFYPYSTPWGSGGQRWAGCYG